MVYNIDKLDNSWVSMYCVSSKLFESKEKKKKKPVSFDYELKPKHYILQLDTVVYVLGNLQG